MSTNAKLPGSAEEDFSTRHLLLQVLLALIFGGMVVRAVFLHVIDKDFLRRQGDARMLRKEVLPAHRGMLLDRNGVPLAVSTPVTSLWINPKEVYEAEHPPKDDKGKDIKPPVFLKVSDLAEAVGLDAVDLERKVRGSPKREFMYLKRHLAPDVADVVLKRGFPGVHGIDEYKRYYPEGEITAHLLGFTDLDDHGKEGLELLFDKDLRGIPGQQMVIRDLKGNKVEDVAQIRPAQPGKDITLSFDSRVQYAAYRELLTAVTNSQARAGMAVALDVQTGEVLAMVNLPTFNPNNRALIRPDDLSALRNRVVVDMFEPGSTMKVFTVAAGLESGKFTPESKFNTNPGSMRVLNHLVRDHENYGVIDTGTIITKSSNVGASQIALALPPEALPTFFQRFGFGKVTGSGFPGEARGLMQPRSAWHPVELSTMSYGNGIAVTALQLAHGYATIANHGVAMPISFTKVANPPPGTRLLSEHIVDQLLPMMESVVTADGTAVKAAVPGYRVAGKTGTAHKPDHVHGGYYYDKYMALFVGLAPVSDPRVVLAIVIDEPSTRNNGYYGGQVSAPVFSPIMAETLRLMNVPTDKPLGPLVPAKPEKH